jgi:hypothetical protein
MIPAENKEQISFMHMQRRLTGNLKLLIRGINRVLLVLLGVRVKLNTSKIKHIFNRADSV